MGPCRPWLLFGALPFGAAFVLMWWIPPIGDPRWLAVYYGAAYFLFDTGFTVIGVPFTAMLPDVASTYDERTSVSAWRMGFSIGTGLLGYAAGDLAAVALPGGRTVGWLGVAAAFAVLSAGSLWVVVGASSGGFDPDNRDARRPTRRRDPPALPRPRRVAVPAMADRGMRGRRPRGVGRTALRAAPLPARVGRTYHLDRFRALRRFPRSHRGRGGAFFPDNRPFLFAAVIFLFTWTTVAVISSVLPFFLTYWLRWEGALVVPMGVMFVSALVLLPFWNWFTVRAGKRAAYVVGMASLVAILVLLSALPSDANRTLVIVIAALAGFGVSAAHVVPNSILPDGIEWEELRTGSRREGFFFGVVSLLNKVGSSVAVPWVALVLAAAKFDESRGADQLPATLVALRLLVGLVPAVLLALGVVAAAAYPLNKGRHQRISRLLELRKARAGARERWKRQRGERRGGTGRSP